MQSGPLYIIRTMASDGRIEERTHASAGAAFSDYLNARMGGWPRIAISDGKQTIEPYDLANRAKHHAA